LIFPRIIKKLEKRFAHPHVSPSILNRSNYKKIWNEVAYDEDHAKTAVSGSANEEDFQRSGKSTGAYLAEVLGVSQEDVVLEIGAGVGRVGPFLAPICKEWIAVDVSENMLAHVRRRLSKFGNVRTVATNGYDLREIPSESVDVVYSTVVFMHLDEWERFSYIREGFRILRRGGRMLVDNVDLTSDAGWQFFLQVCAIPPNERPAQISKTSTPQELETYFQRAGFSDIRQFHEGLWVITRGRKA
jgi:SAM-dependent methyltransferase